MGSGRETKITVAKADTIWLIIVIIAFSMGCMYSRFSEKIAALEDVVFVHGIYKEIGNEKSYYKVPALPK